MNSLKNELVNTFIDDDTFKIKEYKDVTLFYIDALVDTEMIGEIVLKQLNINDETTSFTSVQKKILMSLEDIKNALLDSNVVVYTNNSFIQIAVKKVYQRAINEPDNEKVVSGPKEGFVENIMTNINLIRNRIKTTNLKIKNKILENEKRLSILYLDNTVNIEVLNSLYKRLEKIDKYVLDINTIKEEIKDNKLSSFNLINDSARPDICIKKMLEGKVIILLDGSPSALIVPQLFYENFHTIDDYYQNPYYASFNRLFRFFSFVLTILIPGFYVSLLSFHQELIPIKLAINIKASRIGVPFPTFLECILMISIFEILQEAGRKTPSSLGTSLGIVGALVIGQAIVDARIISTSVLIVVALTALTGLVIPKMSGSIIVLRYIMLILGAFFGIYGLTFGLLFTVMYLVNIKTFGSDYFKMITPFKLKYYIKTYLRVPNETK